MQECDAAKCHGQKLIAFYSKVVSLFNVEWTIKVDDSVYLNPQRLMLAIPQWRSMGVEYVGCMKRGVIIPQTYAPRQRFDREYMLIGASHLLNALGSAFAVHSAVVEEALLPNANSLRLLDSPGARPSAAPCVPPATLPGVRR